MTATQKGELEVKLLGEFAEPGGGRHYTAWAQGRLLGRIRGVPDRGWLRIAVDDAAAISGSAERQGLLNALRALAARERLSGVVLAASSHLLLRHDARVLGFTGPLRADLIRDLGPAAPPPVTMLEDRFFGDLGSLLPGVTVAPAARRAGMLRSFMRSASSGVSGVVHLSVRDATGASPLALSVPLDDDVMAEGVALAIDTALAVRRRFHPLVDRVRVFYDQAIQGLRTGTVAGLAEPSVRDVHLNPAYALVSEMESLERHLLERQSPAPASAAGPGPGVRRSRTVFPPFTRVDSVVAHEYWHQIEFGFESGRYRDSVEFRRAVGQYFGVETLEHAIKGKAPNAPEAWQVAHARLAQEVSSYAATAPKEATAELFKQWWCTVSDPPPSARAFGDILRRFFPAADLVR